ncbi:MAG TPA: BNR repeat-containing protein [Verrucomicrobiae bacterium]
MYRLRIILGLGMALCATAGIAADESIPLIQQAAAVDSLDVARVPADYPVRFALLTHSPYQFVAFYNARHRLTVGQRRLDKRKWTFIKLPDVTGWDSHNSIALTADDDGYLHLCADMHVAPLKYFRTTKPWDASTFQRIARMTGRDEVRCTYPQFLRGAHGELLFTYRDGGSGNGNQIYDCYDLKSKTWSPFLDTPLTDGQGTNNAYFNGPVRGPDGWFHLAWVWRAEPDASTCHDLSYARSRDLKHWETSAGKPLSLPIRLSNCEIVDPVPVHGGIVNGNTRIGFDELGRVTISYHKNDINGNTQPFVARLENGHWVLHQVADWPVPSHFSGEGTLSIGIGLGPVHAGPDGRLTMGFEHFKYGHGTWVLDPQTLHAIGQAVVEATPPALDPVTGKFPGLEVHWEGDDGTSGVAGLQYKLRWETLGANRDHPRHGVLPEPSMLQVIAVETKIDHAANVN